MKHFLFVEEISGEQFIVGEDNFSDAATDAECIAAAIGQNYADVWELRFLCELTDEEAEASGLDEY